MPNPEKPLPRESLIGQNHNALERVPVYPPFFRLQLFLLTKVLQEVENPSVLNLACGDGTIDQALAEACHLTPVLAGDINIRCCSLAKKKLRKTGGHVIRFDIQSLPFPAESFNLITLWEALEHAPSPEQTLKEINRVLRPGGFLLLSTPNADCLNQRIKKRLRQTGKIGQRIVGEERADHLSVMSWKELKKQLKQAGLEIVLRVPSGLIPPGFWFLQKALPYSWAAKLAAIYIHTGQLAPDLAAENFLICQKQTPSNPKPQSLE